MLQFVCLSVGRKLNYINVKDLKKTLDGYYKKLHLKQEGNKNRNKRHLSSKRFNIKIINRRNNNESDGSAIQKVWSTATVQSSTFQEERLSIKTLEYTHRQEMGFNKVQNFVVSLALAYVLIKIVVCFSIQH